MLKIILSLGYFIVLTSLSFSQISWVQTNGPYGGSLKTIGFNISGQIFVGSHYGGLFSSIDEGETWKSISNGLPANSAIGSMSFNNEDNIFIVSNTEAFKSIDNGLHWQKLNISFTQGSTQPVILVDSSQNIYLAAGSKTYISNDGGDSWDLCTNFTSYSICKLVCNKNDIFAGTSNGEIYRTSNHGLNWSKLPIILPGNSISDMIINNKGYILISSSSGVVRSTNNGINWEIVNAGLYDTEVRSLALKVNDEIIISTNYGLYRSTNDGNNWLKVNSNYLGGKIGISKNDNIFLLTESHGIYKSINDGWTFVQKNFGLTNSSIYSFIEINRELYAGTNDGLFFSNDGGLYWTKKGFFTEEVYLLLHNNGRIIVYCPSKYPGYYYSTDNGQNWNLLNRLPNAYTIQYLSNDITGNLFAVTGYDGIYKSSDNGSTWQKIGLEKQTIEKIVINDKGTIFALTGFNGIYRSTDTGVNWTQVNSGFNYKFIDYLSITEDGVLFAGASDGLYTSKNNGDSWFKTGLNTTVRKVILTKQGSYIAGSRSGIYISYDKGLTWQPSNVGLTSTDVTEILINKDGIVFIGTYGGGIFKSNELILPVELSSLKATNNGCKVSITWVTATETNNKGFEIERTIENGDWEKVGYVIGNGTSSEPLHYCFIDNTISKSGKCYYRLKQIDYSGVYNYSKEVFVELNILPKEFTLLQNYPNPFNPSTRIAYQLPADCKVIIKVFNILGDEIITLVNEQKSAGSYEIKFDAGNLQSGIYFYRLQTGDFTQTKQMLLLK